MATFTPKQDSAQQLAELDERVRRAWTDYKDRLHPLDVDDYAAAEPASWDALQAALSDIEADRDRVTRETPAP
jgi:hypothetical protein